MKKIQLLSLWLLSTLITTGQSKVNEGRQTIGYHSFVKVDWATKAIILSAGAPVSEDVDEGVRFTIEDEKSLTDYYIIYFWEFDKTDPEYAKINYDATTKKPFYFAILKTDLDIWSQKIYKLRSATFGAMTLPFKYRPQNHKFEKTFTMGVMGGVTFNPWRTGEHTFSLLAGIAASTATLDKYNTDPAANIEDPSDRAAISFSISFLYQYERLQFGISTGIDNTLDNEITKWKYQGKPWVSIGIGISLFTANEIKNPGTN